MSSLKILFAEIHYILNLNLKSWLVGKFEVDKTSSKITFSSCV